MGFININIILDKVALLSYNEFTRQETSRESILTVSDDKGMRQIATPTN